MGTLVLTAGCDQRLNAWRWDMAQVEAALAAPITAAKTPAPWPLRLCASRTVSIQDVHAVCVCAHGQRSPPAGEALAAVAPPDVVAVAVVGDGLQVVTLDACES